MQRNVLICGYSLSLDLARVNLDAVLFDSDRQPSLCLGLTP